MEITVNDFAEKWKEKFDELFVCNCDDGFECGHFKSHIDDVSVIRDFIKEQVVEEMRGRIVNEIENMKIKTNTIQTGFGDGYETALELVQQAIIKL